MSENVEITPREIYETMNQLTNEVNRLNTQFQLFERESKRAIEIAQNTRDEIDQVQKQRYNEKIDESKNQSSKRTKYYTTILSTSLPIILNIIITSYSITK